MPALMLPGSIVSQGGGEPFSIWGIVEWAKNLVAHALVPDREQRLLDVLLPAAESVGNVLLGAEDAADLRSRLEVVIELPAVYNANATLLNEPSYVQLVNEGISKAPAVDWPIDLVGGAAIPHLRRVERSCRAIVAALRSFSEAQPESFRRGLARRPEADDPLEFLSHPLIHPDIKDVLLGAVRADHCVYALLHVLVSRKAPAPWLRLALAEVAADGYHNYLRLLASEPTFAVPISVIPVADRLSVSAIQQQAAMTDVWLHRFAADDDGATFPFDDDDDS